MSQEKYVSYWKSFEEIFNNQEKIAEKADEVLADAGIKANKQDDGGLSRKQFLSVLGASAALAGTACTNYRDLGEIVAYNDKPDHIYPGIANFYASTCNLCPNSCGILIKTREGRPIGIKGNENHPINGGATCGKSMANILELYDPERIKNPQKNLSPGKDYKLSAIKWTDADKNIIAALSSAAADDKEIAVIAPPSASPMEKKVWDALQQAFLNVKIYNFSLNKNTTKSRGWQVSHGSPAVPLIKWEQAKVILCLEADILGNEGHVIDQSRRYAKNRDLIKGRTLSKFYVVEGATSLTGLNADKRFRVRPDRQLEFVLSLINELIIQNRRSKYAGNQDVIALTKDHSLQKFAQENGIEYSQLQRLVQDLWASQGQAIIFAGQKLDEATHIAVNLLNDALENASIYDRGNAVKIVNPLSDLVELKELSRKMQEGKVAVVIHYNTNPVFHFAPGLNYQNALSKVKLKITLTAKINETAAFSDYILPIHHNFESWGDASPRTGVYSLIQPTINPLHDTRQKEAILLLWAGKGSSTYSYDIIHKFLMQTWQQDVYSRTNSLGDFRTFWLSALHDGVVAVNEPGPIIGTFQINSLARLKQLRLDQKGKQDFVLLLLDNYSIGDGAFADNGWLQELPHPVTKTVWDNFASISPKTSLELDVAFNDVITVTSGNESVDLPVFVQPGMADGVVAVEMGYGREICGTVGQAVGVSVQKLVDTESAYSLSIVDSIKVKKSTKSYKLVSIQEHHAIHEIKYKDFHFKRKIVREGSLEEYQNNPDFILEARHLDHIVSLSENKQYPKDKVKWAMAIDLNKCTGCSNCVTGCNVENNVPVVGKGQVDVGREMHWLRIDRYYSGSVEEPEVSLQPVLCHHCDNAPCENVCPVAATTHSPDGLNGMAYNRCVGTRYCANNCPYKVRRYNFFNFRADFQEGFYEQKAFDPMHNPEVSVRPRGVMEKCSFCIQRIMEARQIARQEGRPVAGGDVQTACQNACPTNAIVFGDIHDEKSDLYQVANHRLVYKPLEELNIRPNISYIAKIKNSDKKS